MTERNRCGSCTMCCKTIGVTDIDKPPNVWCGHCEIGQGCKIYETRPTSCRTYECLWFSNDWMADELRPDRCKIVFEEIEEDRIVLAMVDPKRPDAWKTRNVQAFIQFMTHEFRAAVVICVGITSLDDAVMFVPPGRTRKGIIKSVFRDAGLKIERYAAQQGITFEEAVRQATGVEGIKKVVDFSV